MRKKYEKFVGRWNFTESSIILFQLPRIIKRPIPFQSSCFLKISMPPRGYEYFLKITKITITNVWLSLSISQWMRRGKGAICLSVNDRGASRLRRICRRNSSRDRCYSFIHRFLSVFSRRSHVSLVSFPRVALNKQFTEEGSRSINLEAPGLKFSPPLRFDRTFLQRYFLWPEIRSYRYLALTSSSRS